MLTKKESLLRGNILSLKNFRRKDTSFTNIVVTKLQRKMLLKTVKDIGLKVLNNRKKRLVLPNHRNKEMKEKIKLLSLNINHLSNKREELEVLLKKEKPEIMCLQETWRQLVFPLRLEKYTAIKTSSSGKNKPGLITLVKKNGAIRYSKKGTNSNILQTVVVFRSVGKWIKYLIINVYIPQDRDLKREVLARLLSLLYDEKLKNHYSEI